MFLLIALQVALAADASLRIDADQRVHIEVDGARWHAPEDEPLRATANVTPGRHEVTVTTLRGRPLYTGLVEVPQGYEVRCTWLREAFACPSALQIHQPVVAAAIPTETPIAVDPPAAYGVIIVDRPHSPRPTAVDLVVRTPSGIWTDVLVDGAVVLELRNSREGQARISPGRHTLEFRDFMNDRAWAAGQIDTRRLDRLTVGVTDDKTVTFYDSDGWLTGGGLGVPSIGTPEPLHIRSVGGIEQDLDRPAVVLVDADPWQERSAAAIVPTEVTLRVRSRDGEWADVLVDGQVVMELRTDNEEEVVISPGRHTVEVREFMEDTAYTTGALDTGTASVITLGVEEGKPAVCYDHDGWQAR